MDSLDIKKEALQELKMEKYQQIKETIKYKLTEILSYKKNISRLEIEIQEAIARYDEYEV